MSIDSFAVTPVVPVYEIFSEPAKSTSWSFDVTTLSKFKGSTVSTVIVKIAWDREELLFSLWEATTLFLIPELNKVMTS